MHKCEHNHIRWGDACGAAGKAHAAHPVHDGSGADPGP